MSSKALPANAQALLDQLDSVVEQQRELSSRVQELKGNPRGPYALAYHHGMLLERLENLQLLVRRVGTARGRWTELVTREERNRPQRVVPGRPFSKRVSAIMTEQRELTMQMRLDVETLYVLANMTLDQWAPMLRGCLGLEPLGSYPFRTLVDRMQSASPPGELSSLVEKHLADAIWLCYQVRFYRNVFVEHVDTPWQRGSTMSHMGEDFNFFIGSPVGWLPEGREAQLIEPLRQFTPTHIAELPADHWQRKPRAILEAVFSRIDEISTQADRELVWAAWKEIGGSTVSYDVWMNRLVKFLLGSAETTLSIVEANVETIDMGERQS